MADLLDGFINKKKAESPFLTLEDGQFAVIKSLKNIKAITKAGYDGKEKEVLRLEVLVDTSEGVREKSFDNGTARWAEELKEKGIAIGDGFTITRTGLQAKTRYTISNVVKAAVAPAPEA